MRTSILCPVQLKINLKTCNDPSSREPCTYPLTARGQPYYHNVSIELVHLEQSMLHDFTQGAHNVVFSLTLKQVCLKEYLSSATCVQRFDDSLNSAIRIIYRDSLRSSSS